MFLSIHANLLFTVFQVEAGCLPVDCRDKYVVVFRKHRFTWYSDDVAVATFEFRGLFGNRGEIVFGENAPQGERNPSLIELGGGLAFLTPKEWIVLDDGRDEQFIIVSPSFWEQFKSVLLPRCSLVFEVVSKKDRRGVGRLEMFRSVASVCRCIYRGMDDAVSYSSGNVVLLSAGFIHAMRKLSSSA